MREDQKFEHNFIGSERDDILPQVQVALIDISIADFMVWNSTLTFLNVFGNLNCMTLTMIYHKCQTKPC